MSEMTMEMMEQEIAELKRRIQIEEDIENIRRLRRKYVEAADGAVGWGHNNGRTHNGDVFCELFVEDGVWDGNRVAPRLEGKEAIRNGINACSNTRFQLHFLQNENITIAPDGKTATGVWTAWTAGEWADGRCALSFSYNYDKYVKTEDGWKFKEVFLDSAMHGFLNQTPFQWAEAVPDNFA